MPSDAQLHANRANAQKSTGPKTAAGKSKSAANSSKHGLQANPTTILENNPLERTQYDALKANLLAQLLPEGELELQAFERHVFATFQADRARQHELDAQDRWLNEPSNETWFHQMERIQRLGAMQERRADKALNELRRLQRDRFSALDVANELYLLNQFIPIPAALPVADIRRANQTQTSPSTIAMQLMANSPESQSILKGETKPEKMPNLTLSDEDLLFLMQANKQ
jgi:hypothetical protein